MSQSSRIFTGQITGLADTAQILAVATHASIREVIVQADPDNSTNALVGNSSNQYVKLVPGQGVSIPINNLGAIYVKMESATTGTINWIARD